MTLSTAEIEEVVRDLRPRLQGGRIERMDQTEPDRLVLYVRTGPALYWLMLCTHPHFGRLHLLTMRPPRGKPAAGFCNVLRDHATSAPFDALRQVSGDRIVIVDFTARDRLMQPRRMSLVAELFGPAGNLILVDESGKILAVNRRVDSPRRRLVPGAEYSLPEPPPASARREEENRFAGMSDPGDPLALSRAIQNHYVTLEAEARFSDSRAALARALRSAAKTARRRLRSVEQALAESKNAEHIRRQGELLKIALPRVEPRTEQIIVEDVFDPALPEVAIDLNPALSPEENIEWLFRRYKKAKAGAERLAERAAQTSALVEALDRFEERLATAASEAELVELQQDATDLGMPIGPRRNRGGAGAVETARGPRVFHAEDGTEILVARSRRENERLTLSIARGNDYWLHLADWPGPHVVVRAPNGEVSEGALLDAAHLTVHFSKLRGAEQADVIYTQCKNVRRIKGGQPGRVGLARAKTLRVRMDPERLERLLAPPGPGMSSVGR
jgi:predicted ribosome quality control (RQC) complex YloA/Tae2 family protein